MSCDDVRQSLLELGWSPADRLRVQQVLSHLESCPECRQAADDYQRLVDLLANTGDQVRPDDGWANFEYRLERVAIAPAKPWWSPVGATIAASLLIAATAFTLGRFVTPDRPVSIMAPTPVERGHGNGGTVTFTQFTAQEISRGVKEFQEVSGAFDRRASWVMDADGQADVGIADAPVDQGKQLLLLRLSMFRDRESVSSTDLVIVPGHAANLTAPLQQGCKLHYKIATSAGQPTHLSIWVEIQTPRGDQTLAALATDLQVEPNHQIKAGQLVTSAGAYELHIGFAQAAMPRGTQ